MTELRWIDRVEQRRERAAEHQRLLRIAESGVADLGELGDGREVAGGGETSVLWYNFPALVKTAMLPKLPDTKLGPEDLAEWRKGWDNARAKTPLGYLGDPSSASLKRGEQAFHGEATRLADAILKHMELSPWMKQGPQH